MIISDMTELQPALSKAPQKRGRPIEKGQVLNPAGRPKGSRNKLGEDFLRALSEDFSSHGIKAVAAVRENDPSTYLRVIASTLPKELKIERKPESDYTDDEIATLIDAVRGSIGLIAAPRSGDETARRPEVAH